MSSASVPIASSVILQHLPWLRGPGHHHPFQNIISEAFPRILKSQGRPLSFNLIPAIHGPIFLSEWNYELYIGHCVTNLRFLLQKKWHIFRWLLFDIITSFSCPQVSGINYILLTPTFLLLLAFKQLLWNLKNLLISLVYFYLISYLCICTQSGSLLLEESRFLEEDPVIDDLLLMLV